MKPTKDVDITHVIDAASMGRTQWSVILLCVALISVDGFDLVAMGFAAPKIAVEWRLPAASFGAIFSSSLFGLMLGAFALGFAGDRLGRKWVLVISMALVAVFTLLTAVSTTSTELLVYRFLTGLGLGGTIPTATSMTSEYSPRRLRATLVAIMACGFPFGATLGGLASGYLIAAYGWPAIFHLCGALAAVIAVLVLFLMPESARFLASRSPENPRIGRIIENIDAKYSYSPGDRFILTESVTGSVSLGRLFNEGRAAGTALIWALCFFNLLTNYFFLNWLPTLFRQTGLPLDKAIYATTLFAGGGVVGAIVLGRFMDRSAALAAMVTCYIAAGVSVVALGWFSGSLLVTMVLITLAGVFMVATQVALYAVSAGYYPTTIRATGVGWALGFGRLGAIVGPLLGGLLLSLDVSMQVLFSIIAIPLLICAVAMVLLVRHQAQQAQSLATSPPQGNQGQRAAQSA